MAAGTREKIRVGALTIRFLIEGEASGGSIAAYEFEVPARTKVPIPHSHDAYEETVYGLEGVLTWTIDGKSSEVGPGELLCIRRGAVHFFENAHERDAKGLATVTPGILGSGYFRELSVIIDAAQGGPPDLDAIAATMRRHGLTLAR